MLVFVYNVWTCLCLTAHVHEVYACDYTCVQGKGIEEWQKGEVTMRSTPHVHPFHGISETAPSPLFLFLTLQMHCSIDSMFLK